ncbi:MAG: xanthine dehydrogenase family protein subunit M [Candidatus Rokubacteria bacterium]|nr:xanthine dehydrogenase family protein subunit M [Candidatus Rokubacteria bacterium]
MKPAPFEYVRARTLREALGALGRGADCKILAGGQSLVPMMNMRLVRPARLVDINAVPELSGIAARADGGVTIGALTRHTDLVVSPVVHDRAALLATAAAHVGHRAIRNRGTLGGSLAHADPAAELPAALVALDATLVIEGPRGRRRLAIADFFVGLLTTALGADEILVAIDVPGPPHAGWGFAELARRAGDFAIAGVAGIARPDDSGRCRDARLVAFGAADRPVRLRSAEGALIGTTLSDEAITRAGAEAARECDPPDDVHASSEYRRHLVAVLTEDVARAARDRRAAAAGSPCR